MNGLDIIESLYFPLGWELKNIVEEEQNQAYGGYLFMLNTYQIRFRIAKITSKKSGQFVAFWQKYQGENQAYDYCNSPDFLVIYTEKQQHKGHFVFPKDVLKQRGILRAAQQKGKMGMRVYPAWDRPTSLQAQKTQAWQLAYFVETPNDMKKLYK